MIKEVATTLYDFFNSFEIPAYVTNFVPNNARLPYITYDAFIGKPLETVPIGIKVWYEGNLPTKLFETVEKIKTKIGKELQLHCGNGFLYIFPGTPFAQPAADENPNVSVFYLNINISYDLN